MSAATISRPQRVAVSVPLYTRHAPGVIEAARDRRIQARDHAVHRSTGEDATLAPSSEGDEIARWTGEGGRFVPERLPVAAPARVAPAS